MNACIKYAARRAGRFNLWALVVIIGLGGVFVVKAQLKTADDVQARFFTSLDVMETPQER